MTSCRLNGRSRSCDRGGPGSRRAAARRAARPPVRCTTSVSSRIGLVLVLGAWWGHAGAQTPATAPTSQPAILHVEPAFGFELQLPGGWDYDRSRFQEFEDSIGLLRGRAAGGRQGLQILVFRSFPMKPFEDWVIDFGKAVGELTNSPRVDWETWRLPPRAGAILTCTSKLGALTTRSHYLCVPFDPNTVWVLIYTSSAASAADEQAIRQAFDRIINTLRIHYDPDEAERLAPAFERGKALLERLRGQADRVRFDDAEYAYEMTLGGRPIGYLTRRLSREDYVFSGRAAKRRYAKAGLRVRERSWRFLDDGTIRHTRLDLFSSFDGQSELIENQQTMLPPPGAAPTEVLVRTDQVVREADVLFSSLTTSRDTTLPEPSKPISVGPVYLDQAWVRLLPRLLSGEPNEPVAVAIYDSETRALLSHVARPLGERRLEGVPQTVHAFELRDGLIGRPSTAYVDANGSLLRLEAAELTIQRVPREKIERQYGPRRDEARRRFNITLE